MKTFKSFITEHRISLGADELIDIHMKYHTAGIPLPDRDGLYRKYTGGPIRYPKEDGGFVEHNMADKSITHYTANETAHRTDGPAIENYHQEVAPSKIWALNGETVGEHREFKYGDGASMHSFFIHKQHRDRSGGWSSHEVNTLGEFNKHLADHGFPPHKVEE